MIGTFGGIYTYQQGVKNKGERFDSHSHPFDHVTIIARGPVRIHWFYPDELWAQLEAKDKIKGRTKQGSMDLTGPAMAPVLAGVFHELEALDDGGFDAFCIHATRDAEGVVIGAMTVDDYLGKDV